MKNNIEKLTTDILTKNKNDYFKNNKCKIDRIENTNEKYSLILADTYCPIFKGVHADNERSSRKFTIISEGKAFMECTHGNCTDKIYPKNAINIELKILCKIFTSNININSIRLIVKNMKGVFSDE